MGCPLTPTSSDYGRDTGFWGASMWCLQEGSWRQLNLMRGVLGGFKKDVVALQESWRVMLISIAGGAWRSRMASFSQFCWKRLWLSPMWSWNVTKFCYLGDTLGQARIYITGHGPPGGQIFYMYYTTIYIHCFSGPMSWSDVERLKCQQHACHELLNMNVSGSRFHSSIICFPASLICFASFTHACIRPRASNMKTDHL